MSIAVFLILTIVFLAIGVPVALSVGIPSFIYILLADMPNMVIIQRLFTGIATSSLLAIPFFVLAGEFMNSGGIAKRLVRLANAMVGNIYGGLGIVSILGCMFFAAISGSGVATTAAIGGLMIPAMVEKRYDRDFASAIIASASPLGVVIPPSISFVIYGVLAGVSIADLYVAGIFAGMIMGLFLILTTLFISKKHDYRGDESKVTGREFLGILKDSLWAIGTPLIIVGGVFGGIFTPTESAVVAVFYGLFVGLFIYKELKLKDLPGIIFRCAKTSASVMFIISNAAIFAWILAYARIPNMLLQAVLNFTSSKVVILLLINIILLIAGTFMETGAIITIATPLLVPLAKKFGIDLIHLGIIISANTAIGLATPPFGVCTFTAASVGETQFHTLVNRLWPLIIALIAAVLLITYVPQLVMFLL